MSAFFWRCDDCGETQAMTAVVKRVTGGLAGLLGDPDSWLDTDVDVVIEEDAEEPHVVLRPAEETGPMVLPPPGCQICGRTMRRVVSVFDARDWSAQFPVT